MVKDWRVKTRELFAERFPEVVLRSAVPPRMKRALRHEYGKKRAYEIAFHLSDWREDAAFLVALELAPERFTSKDIRDGVMGCLIHIPNHVVAAATHGRWEMRDIFKVGARIKPPLRDRAKKTRR